MVDDERRHYASDRRAHPRGGRRTTDGKPWYLRRRLWLAVGSVLFVRWRRMKALAMGRRRQVG